MIVIVPSAYVKEAEADLKRRREKFYRIGRIEKGDTGKARVVYSGSLNL
jgi:phosphoribosylaminoimidazole (AIR) synthetase